MVTKSGHKLRWLMVLVLTLMLAACGGDDGGGSSSGGGAAGGAGDNLTEGNVTYRGYGNKAGGAVEITIVYSPESEAYMPELMQQFNQAYADGKDPITGADLAGDAVRVYVRGTDPVQGSSGTVMQGIVNAVTDVNSTNVYTPTIFQPSVGHWLALANEYSRRDIFDIDEAQATANSPVVIATWESRLEAMRSTLGKDTIGWQDILGVFTSPGGWCDYNLPDCRRAVYYGHADPNHSSTGLSTTIAQYYACARQNGFTERRLTEDAVNDPAISECVENIQHLVKHYSRRTEDFLEYIGLGPDYLDFLAMEETDVICINTGGSQGGIPCVRPPRGEKLVAIYPEEGTYWHEHPFGILNAEWVSDEQRDAAQLFTDYIISEAPQRRIMQEGFRPVNPDVALEAPFTAVNGVDPAGPASTLSVPEADSVIAIQETWDLVKKKTDVMLLVDVSGSMQGERIDQAREGIRILMQNMKSSNRVGMMSFSHIVTFWNPLDFVESNINSILLHATGENPMSDGSYQPTVRDAPFHNFYMQADGGTSLYTATRLAIDALDVMSDDADRIRVVLLLSDGEDTCDSEGCSSLEEVISKIERTYDTPNPVIVIPIAYALGENREALRALEDIAEASGTRVVSGDPATILDVLTLLSGYF